MSERVNHLPNFLLAFLLAPVAGAVSVLLLGFFLLRGHSNLSLSNLPSALFFVGGSAYALCAVFTGIAGGCAIAYLRSTGRIPSLASALLIGVAVAYCTFVLVGLPSGQPDYLGVPVFAAACSLPTAWAFWFLGLRGRRAVTAPIQPRNNAAAMARAP